jgi:hypothetical protein
MEKKMDPMDLKTMRDNAMAGKEAVINEKPELTEHQSLIDQKLSMNKDLNDKLYSIFKAAKAFQTA